MKTLLENLYWSYKNRHSSIINNKSKKCVHFFSFSFLSFAGLKKYEMTTEKLNKFSKIVSYRLLMVRILN